MTAGPAVTLDLNTHFIGGGRVGEPLEAQVELLRETGRLLFLRGLLVQGETTVAEFSGTIRKPTRGMIPSRRTPAERGQACLPTCGSARPRARPRRRT